MGNKNPPPDERVVYLALKNIFKGPNAEIRQGKAIRRLVKEHQTREDLADLIREHEFDVVCASAKTLLCDEVFASTLKAKIRFPELFDLSPIENAERETSEAEAARQVADAIKHAVNGGDDDLGLAGPLQGVPDVPTGRPCPLDILVVGYLLTTANRGDPVWGACIILEGGRKAACIEPTRQRAVISASSHFDTTTISGLPSIPG